MNLIIEPAEPNGVVSGQPLVMGERGEIRQLPSRSPHLDGGPPETLAAVTVGIVGLGYVGLSTALSLVRAGMQVVGYDVSETRLAAIKAGRVDLLAIDRDRLECFLHANELVLTTESGALAAAAVVVICVPTPVDEHLVPDLAALRGACKSVVGQAVAGQAVVLTSTTYVGCTRDLLADPLRERGFTIGEDIFVAFSPERINPGDESHVPECTPRVVGGITPECTRRVTEVLRHTALLLHTVSSPEAAEMTKLLENTFRAVNIALANEFSTLARELDVDPMEVIGAAATKPFGFMPFYPGPGVGGHCIPCDPHYLLWQLKARRTAAPLTTAAMEAIAGRPRAVVARAQQVLAEHGRPLAGAQVLVLGVTYKPGVADVRESPALEIIAKLAHAGAMVAYSDALVETIHTVAGTLVNEDNPGNRVWDLVIVHTLQPGTDHSWLATAPVVLDATYQLDGHVSHYAL
jgi:UDP-N-acetyl-D-glucosamine dehydrogenase